MLQKSLLSHQRKEGALPEKRKSASMEHEVRAEKREEPGELVSLFFREKRGKRKPRWKKEKKIQRREKEGKAHVSEGGGEGGRHGRRNRGAILIRRKRRGGKKSQNKKKKRVVIKRKKIGGN